MAAKFIFSFIDRDENGIYKDMTSKRAEGIIEFLPSHKMFDSKLGEKVSKALLSFRFQRTPFGEIAQNMLVNLENYKYLPENEYYVLIPSTSVGKLSLQYIERFAARHKNVKLFPVLTDCMHASSPHMEYVRNKLFSTAWERVLTFDKNDAEEYGFTFMGYSWYSKFEGIEPAEDHRDLFYVGFKKGNREKLISDIYELGINNGATCDIRVVSNENIPVYGDSKLMLSTEKLPYKSVVSLIESANCVLEVLQEGQDTQTIKYHEAIAYGKKLLTNNKHLFELPYYDDSMMKYFENAEDIDWDWVKSDEMKPYNYQGEFSPIYLVDFLKDLYQID